MTKPSRPLAALALLAASALLAAPVAAQDGPDMRAEPRDAPATVFDGDYITIGIGAGLAPSYDGSDDYVVFPLPLVQGSLGGVGINPRAAGVALDFVPDPETGPGFDAGVVARIRRNRASRIEDEVVERLGELDTAWEVGPTAGVSMPAVLNPYDSLTFTTDVLFDVAGAHDGMVVSPSIAYFTPLSEGMAASLSVSAEYSDGDFADYYYAVDPAGSVASGLPVFDPDGGGFNKAGVNLLLAYDLDGDLRNGGLGLFGIGGYSRMLGDAKDSPLTAIRGSADQWFVGAGIGYTF
ncbi:MipA/OmpV family protein [Aurantiacibacter spongiae]|uniref:MipA/OmpV family protein n=1 Tax=Aurantiacibacter spongiae TaxID=2488860 RepID=A0A3N5CSR5_9SPHN|nr:MipA/OmpV family protein [Aurantiacibacter spongiae]RPF72184.1 MipA/OmpV family protein [Aurantiacibacter spongiae]